MICKICGQHNKSSVHCPKNGEICDKCCMSCKYLNFETSFMICNYIRDKKIKIKNTLLLHSTVK